MRFSDYRPLPPDTVGHPHGLVWFCGRHVAAARQLTHLPEAEALAQLARDSRGQGGTLDP